MRKCALDADGDFNSGCRFPHRSQGAPFRLFLQRSTNRWTICLLVFCLCILIFAHQGLGRAFVFTDYAGFSDHAYNYLAARAWIRGLNPYSLDNAVATIPADFPSPSRRGFLQYMGTPYPPAIFPLYAP